MKKTAKLRVKLKNEIYCKIICKPLKKKRPIKLNATVRKKKGEWYIKFVMSFLNFCIKI